MDHTNARQSATARRVVLAAWIGAMLALVPIGLHVRAHAVASSEAPVSFGETLALWSWEPLVVISLLIGAVLYGVGLRSRRSVPGIDNAIPTWRVVCYYAGLASIALAPVSSFGALSGRLFFMHMISH